MKYEQRIKDFVVTYDSDYKILMPQEQRFYPIMMGRFNEGAYIEALGYLIKNETDEPRQDYFAYCTKLKYGRLRVYRDGTKRIHWYTPEELNKPLTLHAALIVNYQTLI